jgi:hypothetical protein
MTGPEADRLVADVETLSAEELRRLEERPDADALYDEYVTAKCLTSTWWMAKYGLGWDMRHYWPPLHRRFSRWLDTWRMDRHGVEIPVFMKVGELAREHCKTWWGVAHDLKDMARDTSVTILLRSFKDRKAYEIVAMEKAAIKSNKEFRRRFPWVKPATENGRETEWTKDRFRIESSIVGQRESTVEAYGLKSEATGSHFKKRRYDDIGTAEIENSEILRADMLDTFKHDSNLGTAGTRVLLLGTPYHVRGLFYHLEQGDFSELVYDLFKQPATFRVIPLPLKAHEPILLADRVTLKLSGVRLPDGSDWTQNLQYCQARVTLWSEFVKDTHTEIREIEWNDGDTVRLNRPIPEVFGQPLTVSLGPDKPACPGRFTMDEIHLEAKSEAELPRNSLVIKRRELGPVNYSSQMMLNPVDPESLLLKESDIQWIEERDLPRDNVILLRATDFASWKKTSSSTALMTGHWHCPPGGLPRLWVRHIKFGQLKPTDILLELFLGLLRCETWGYPLRETIMEEEGRKQTLQQYMDTAMRDPFDFFTAMGPEYQPHAERYFKDRGALMLRHRDITRGRGRKEDRISAQLQPAFQAHMIGFVKGIEHLDDVLEEVNTFTLQGDGCPHLDLLDCLSDLVQFGPSRPRAQQAPAKTTGLWQRTQQRALIRSARANGPLTWRG